MGICRADIYKDNFIVTHYPFVCFGGFGQSPCQYLMKCVAENNMKLKKRRKRGIIKEQ